MIGVRGEVIGNTKINGYVIDTCFTTDTDKYETAIWIESDPWGIVVVDYYYDRDIAARGHQYWIDKCQVGLTDVMSVQDFELHNLSIE